MLPLFITINRPSTTLKVPPPCKSQFAPAVTLHCYTGIEFKDSITVLRYITPVGHLQAVSPCTSGHSALCSTEINLHVAFVTVHTETIFEGL